MKHHWTPFMGGFAHVNTGEEHPRLSRREKKELARLLKLLDRRMGAGPVMQGWLKMRGVFAVAERRRK